MPNCAFQYVCFVFVLFGVLGCDVQAAVPVCAGYIQPRKFILPHGGKLGMEGAEDQGTMVFVSLTKCRQGQTA
jgi:hypothetical protein